MNFDEAIQAHSAWKMKLSRYLRAPDGSIKAADIQPDCNCALGKWIYGDGKKWNTLSEYGTLRTEHARFHQEAARIVSKADTGKAVSEELYLGANSEFAKTSGAVVKAIMDIRRKAV
ncbi:MAG: CZB domain-containing protein [Capsulimonadaceae bacterium]|nr:CZB domain-containing protein [Capsulimonadaceae bacterium]